MFPKINIFIDVKNIVVDINPVDYAVKITHIPTSIITECRSYKSHYKNKIEAILSLKKTPYERELKKNSSMKTTLPSRSVLGYNALQ